GPERQGAKGSEHDGKPKRPHSLNSPKMNSTDPAPLPGTVGRHPGFLHSGLAALHKSIPLSFGRRKSRLRIGLCPNPRHKNAVQTARAVP
ncbi:hypothetical protein RQ832_25060, partial [Roseomonas sp. DSM 102946]|nr:hypothetical protein [Roseomonas sp. DSM 102946]